mgnify:CR=1 FL=1
MTPEESYSFIGDKITDLMGAEEAVSAFIDFYDSKQIEGCPKENEDDMLLFQYSGPSSSTPYVSINLTRQYVFYENGEYENMAQLRLDMEFKAKDVTLESGNFWLENMSVKEFKNKVFNSVAFQQVKDLKPMNTYVEYGEV